MKLKRNEAVNYNYAICKCIIVDNNFSILFKYIHYV